MSAVQESAAAPRRRQFKTLVLNSDFRPLATWPLSLIPAQEAVHAWFRDRVTVVENWPDAFYHSPSTKIPVPKVVALKEWAKVGGTPKFCRRSLLLRDSFECQYCGRQFESQNLTFDHLIPRSRGGTTVWTNIVSACMACNAAKADRTDMRPKRLPRRPTSMELLRAGLKFLPNDIRESWSDYLYWNVDLEP